MRLRIKETAMKQGLNKAQLARRCDMNQATIDKVWTDPTVDVQGVNSTTIDKIAMVLNVNAKDLIV